MGKKIIRVVNFIIRFSEALTGLRCGNATNFLYMDIITEHAKSTLITSSKNNIHTFTYWNSNPKHNILKQDYGHKKSPLKSFQQQSYYIPRKL